MYVLHLNRVICLNDCTLEPWVSQLLLLPVTCIVSTSGLRPLLQLETLLSTVGWQSLYHNHNQIEKFKLFPILRLNPLCFSMGQYSLGDPLYLVTKRRYKLLRDVIRGHHFPFWQRCWLERGDGLPGRLEGHSVMHHTQFLWVFKALGIKSGAKAQNFSSEGILQPNLAG